VPGESPKESECAFGEWHAEKICRCEALFERKHLLVSGYD